MHEEADEPEKVGKLARGQGVAMLALGISISLDELATGFTIGLLHLSLWLAVLSIGTQAFLFAQSGCASVLSSTKHSASAEQVAGLALLALALLLVVEKLV